MEKETLLSSSNFKDLDHRLLEQRMIEWKLEW
jgi:hypothetical protein